MNRRILSLALLVFALSGCASPEKPSLSSKDPNLLIPAMQEAARTHDEQAVGQLVVDLESDDPAIRFYAIRALKEITGNTLGYRYYDEDAERKPAVKRWKQWLKDRESAATKP